MKIISLTAENIKRLRAVRISPTGSAIVLAGENEQGKSSILDAIQMALQGKKAMPPVPVHQGETRGKIVIDMGDYKVTRTITPAGNGTLTVEAPNGTTFKSPQAVLDRLLGDLTFDPMAFVEMEPAKAAVTLRTLAGIDTSAIDQQIIDARDERRAILRDLELQRAAIGEAESFPDDGLEILDGAGIAEMLLQADQADAAVRTLETVANNLDTDFERAKRRVSEAVERVAVLEKELAYAREQETAARAAGNTAFLALKAAQKAYAEAVAAAPDTAGIRQRVIDATEHNRRVQANIRYHQIARRLRDQNDRADALANIERALKTERDTLLQAAKFPVVGLGIDEQGTVTWNGLPFEQASEAVRVRVSVAIGIALNPELKVILIRNGNDLGHNNLHLIAQMAEAHGAQVWIERIAGGDGLQTVVIEDGEVVGAQVAPAEPEAPPAPAAELPPPAKKKLRVVSGGSPAVKEALAEMLQAKTEARPAEPPTLETPPDAGEFE